MRNDEILYTLDNNYIEINYNEFINSYGNTDNSSIISSADFQPETFYVSQKLNGDKLIFFNDISSKIWINDIIFDICKDIDFEGEKKELYELAYSNLMTLLNYKSTAREIANQEFVDIIRKVITYTMTGNIYHDIDYSYKFNNLSKQIMPYVISHFNNKEVKLEELIVYSILSGLSGLDLKGAPAASSVYANTGISMKEYYNLEPTEAAQKYINSISDIYNKCSIGLFDYNKFEQLLSNKSQLVWMTDDYIETYFDLLIISRILDAYSINIVLIPKNGHYGNDMCYKDLMEILSLNLYPNLNTHISTGRLKISNQGSKMGAANIRKLSNECIDLIRQSDAVLMKGCRIHEMLQGGINKETFTSFVVVRKISEITSGFKSSEKTVLFFHLEPKEYSFWGTNYYDANYMKKNSIQSVSTIKEHFYRKNLTSIDEVVYEFNKLSKLLNTYLGSRTPLYNELDMLSQKIKKYTEQQYNIGSRLYTTLHRPEMAALDKDLWELLFKNIKLLIKKPIETIKLLDIGTGDGRALEYLYSLGIDCRGVDISSGFINTLREKEASGLIPKKSFIQSDMCNLNIESSQFDVVRMNASLLHLPVIDKGFSADLAIQEAYRVLKSNGLIFILVKYGTELTLMDTKEGLGSRVYQLYNHEMLSNLITRNGFSVIEKIDKYENRGNEKIHWIAQIACKS